MIRLTDSIYIGDSSDEEYADLDYAGISAILNVAHDMESTRGWHSELEYMQVGLIDGPGNHLSAYYAVILSLVALCSRHNRVLVCCHSGGRSLAVSLMYLHLVSRRGWDGSLEILRERCEVELPIPHEAHRVAFDKLDWKLLIKLVEGK